MAGFVIDIIVIFLYRLIAICLGSVRSRNWLIVPGVLEQSAVVGGYPAVDIAYTYRLFDEQYSDVLRYPFWSSRSAERYAKTLRLGTGLKIRVKETEPSVSFLRFKDQRSSATLLTSAT